MLFYRFGLMYSKGFLTLLSTFSLEWSFFFQIWPVSLFRFDQVHIITIYCLHLLKFSEMVLVTNLSHHYLRILQFIINSKHFIEIPQVALPEFRGSLLIHLYSCQDLLSVVLNQYQTNLRFVSRPLYLWK